MSHNALKKPLEIWQAFMTRSHAHTNPAPHSTIAAWLLLLADWLALLAGRLSPQKRVHRGEAPLLGGGGVTLPMDLSLACGRTQAAILQKIVEWQDHNRRKGQTLYDGHYWTYISYKKLHDDHFRDRHEDTIRKAVRALEKAGLLISYQPTNSSTKWYRVDLKAVSRVIQGVSKTPPLVVKTSTPGGQNTHQGVHNAPPITSQTTNLDGQIKKQNRLHQQPALADSPFVESSDTVVVVVELPPHREPEPESGEHILDGEGAQTAPRHAVQSSALVKAMHKDGSNDENPSKVPLKVSADGSIFATLTDSERDLVAVMMTPYARLGLTEDYAARLITAYGEAAVRACHQFIQANWTQYAQGHKSRIYGPPGWMTAELATKRVNPPAVVAGLTVYESESDSHVDPLPPALNDPAWNDLVTLCADGIPELKRAVCRVAGDEYEIAVSGPSVYIPLVRHLPAIKQQLAQIVGHTVKVFVTVDERLEDEVQA